MYVDWEYYKIFYYVAKYQNFTKAARVLGNNQPNITHSMNRLESQLNCVLFIRSNRGVTLTPEGELLYSPHCICGGADPGCRRRAERQRHAGTRCDQHQRYRNCAEHLPCRKAACLPHGLPPASACASPTTPRRSLQAVKNGEVDFAVITTPARWKVA
mgnify:CR=1 FL=1